MRGVTREFGLSANHHSISTHTPHARRDMQSFVRMAFTLVFQLTRLMRGVTKGVC